MTNCAARGHILHSKDMPRTVTQGLFLGFRPQEGNAFAAVPVIPSDRLLGAPFHLLRPKSAGSPPVLPLLVLPGFWGGRMRDSSKVAFFFRQEGTNNLMPGGKSPAPCRPLAGSPGSLAHVTDTAEKENTAGLWGAGGRFVICE